MLYIAVFNLKYTKSILKYYHRSFLKRFLTSCFVGETYQIKKNILFFRRLVLMAHSHRIIFLKVNHSAEYSIIPSSCLIKLCRSLGCIVPLIELSWFRATLFLIASILVNRSITRSVVLYTKFYSL